MHTRIFLSIPLDDAVVCCLTNGLYVRAPLLAEAILRLRRVPDATWLQKTLA